MRARDGERLFLYYTVAERLGIPVSDVRKMPLAELNGWLAYWSLKNEK